MDHFGIGAATSSMLAMYFETGRRTGRTSSLVESVKDGDRLIFTTEREARRVKTLCKERGVDIEIAVCDPAQPDGLLIRPPARGRTMFDHTWVEQFYMNKVTRATADIDYLEKVMSREPDRGEEPNRSVHNEFKWS